MKTIRLLSTVAALLALSSCATQPLPATRLDLGGRAPAYAGAVFEATGAYETVAAVAHTPSGRADVVILRPVNPARGSGVLVAEIVGSEGRMLPRMLNDGDARFDRADSAGNGFLMRRGHTMVWVSGAALLGDVMPLLKAELKPDVTLAIGVGEGGRALQDMIRDRYNAVPGGGKLFDGIMPLMAGAGEAFPFTYGTMVDAVSARRGGILMRCTASQSCPRVMHIDSSNEFWQSRAALIATGGGKADLPFPDDVRAYLLSSTQHVSADRPAPGECQHLSNPAQQSPVVRAMLDHLVAWSRNGKRPPDSSYPTVAGAMLTRADRESVGFPDLRSLGVAFPDGMAGDARDPLLVPMADQDGHDIAGIRLPDIEVPLATHAGWNLKRARGAQGALCGGQGLFVPFAATPRAGDPRRALSQRYPTRIEYAKAVALSARGLRDRGLLLQEDVDRFIARAMRETRLP